MRQSTYLNVILTVNAGLLAAVVWTQLADRPVLAQPASAQSSQPVMKTTTADRQLRMIEIMGDMQTQLEAINTRLESGKLKVEVINLKAGDVASVD